MDIIEIDHLTCRFPGGRTALLDLSLRIPAGQFVVLAGPNGSGKTTLLRHLNGLLTPSAGSVRVAGLSVAKHLKSIRQLVGMVFQDADAQIVGETVFDDAAFGPENLGWDRARIHERVMAALVAVGLASQAEKRPHALSGGEKRRLAVAGILVMEPQVVVFDEPFSNLDYPGVRQVLGEMLRLCQEGRTLLVATHDLDRVIPHADRLILLEEGRIARDGDPRALMAEVERFGVRRPCAACLERERTPWPA